MSLMTPGGETIRTYLGSDDALWLDSESFIVYQYARRLAPPNGPWIKVRDESGNPVTTTLLGTVSTSERDFVEVPAGVAVSSLHGALAIVDLVSEGRFEFTIWTPTGKSEAHDGYPIGWSVDGSRVALVHVIRSGPGIEGWLVVSCSLSPRGEPDDADVTNVWLMRAL